MPFIFRDGLLMQSKRRSGNAVLEISHPVQLQLRTRLQLEIQLQLERLDEPSRSRHHDAILYPESQQEHGVLQERADLTLERFAPVVLTDLDFSCRRSWDPAWGAALVIEIVPAEDRFEHAFPVADDQLVFDRAQQHRRWPKPQDAREGDQS